MTRRVQSRARRILCRDEKENPIYSSLSNSQQVSVCCMYIYMYMYICMYTYTYLYRRIPCRALCEFHVETTRKILSRSRRILCGDEKGNWCKAPCQTDKRFLYIYLSNSTETKISIWICTARYRGFKFNQNLNLNLYRQIPRNLTFSILTSWLKALCQTDKRFLYNSLSYVYTYVYVCVYGFVYTFICIYAHVCVHLHIYMLTCIYIYIYKCMHKYICIYMYKCICIYICTHVYVCIHIYVYIYVFIYVSPQTSVYGTCVRMYVCTMCASRYLYTYVHMHVYVRKNV